MIDFAAHTLDGVEDIKEETLTLPGWKPIKVRYGLYYTVSGQTELLWNVTGTAHTFKVPIKVIYDQHRGEVRDHFTVALQAFRRDYLSWYKDGWQEEWMKGYWDFGPLIYA